MQGSRTALCLLREMGTSCMQPAGLIACREMASSEMLLKAYKKGHFQVPTLAAPSINQCCQATCPAQVKEGRKESSQHPWQPTRLNGWNSVCSLRHSLCSTSCTNQTEEPCEPPARCSTNITSQAIIAGQGSVYAHNHCHKEQSSTQQDKPPSGRALEMLQARPPVS